MRYKKNYLSIFAKISTIILAVILVVFTSVFFVISQKTEYSIDSYNITNASQIYKNAIISFYPPTYDEYYADYLAMQNAYDNPSEASPLVPVSINNSINWVDPSRPVIALTFDDGPAGESSDSIYATLEQYDVRATFFLSGTSLEKSYAYEKIERIVELNCQIGNHTYNHYNLRNAEPELIIEEEQLVIDILDQTNNNDDRYVVRMPYGILTADIKENISAPIIHWNKDSRDWDSETVEEVIANLGEVKDGDILLFHDIHNISAETMKVLIPDLLEQGFQFLTIDEIFYYKNIPLENGQVYYSAS